MYVIKVFGYARRLSSKAVRDLGLRVRVLREGKGRLGNNEAEEMIYQFWGLIFFLFPTNTWEWMKYESEII